MKISKEKVSPADATTCYQFDPQLGFWGIPNIEIKFDFGEVVHDSDGNRNFRSINKPDRECIICYGGSHTWGGGVDQKLRYTDQLEKRSGKVVLNTGHCSLGLDQICLAILNRSAKYKPGIIIVEQYPWAIHRILNNYVNGYVRPFFYLDSNNELKLQKIPIIAKYALFRHLIGVYYSFRKEFREFCLDLNIKHHYDPLTDPIFLYWKARKYDAMYELAEKILLVMAEYCRKNKIKLLFALGGIQQEFGKLSNTDLIDYALPKKRFVELLDAQSIAYVDVGPHLLQVHSETNPVIFPDGHINAAGHKIFSDVIYQTLIDKGWA